IQVRMAVQDAAGNQAQASQVIGGPAGTGAAVAAAPMGPAGTPGTGTGADMAALPPPPAGFGRPVDPPSAPRDVQPAVRTETTSGGSSPVATSPRMDLPSARADSGSGITPVATNSPGAPT